MTEWLVHSIVAEVDMAGCLACSAVSLIRPLTRGLTTRVWTTCGPRVKLRDGQDGEKLRKQFEQERKDRIEVIKVSILGRRGRIREADHIREVGHTRGHTWRLGYVRKLDHTGLH